MTVPKEIPIVIPCFNNPTYVRSMLTQLRALRKTNFILVDGHSTYPAMLELLRQERSDVRIVRLRRNHGPHFFCRNWLFYVRLPGIFCVTDPDLRFNAQMPIDFLEVLEDATETFSVGKAGLALDISRKEEMRTDLIAHAGKIYNIWEWESRFWKEQISMTAYGDPIYRATIDTTFALYNKKFFTKRAFEMAVRIGGR